MTERGSVCWADLGEARGSKPAKRRPILVIQSDPFNASRLNTTIAAVITSNTALAAMPGNVFLPAAVLVDASDQGSCHTARIALPARSAHIGQVLCRERCWAKDPTRRPAAATRTPWRPPAAIDGRIPHVTRLAA